MMCVLPHCCAALLLPEGSRLALWLFPAPALTLVEREVPDGVVRLPLVVQVCQLLECHSPCKYSHYISLFYKAWKKDDIAQLGLQCLLFKNVSALSETAIDLELQMHPSGKLRK